VEVLKTVAPIQVGKAGVAPVTIGGTAPIVLIAGPCVIESEEGATQICAALQAICSSLGVKLVFKASFDKANRTSLGAFRGPGLEDGLRVLRNIRARFGVPITTDVHEPHQAESVSELADLLQIPAFLARQTDLLVACARTGSPINLKKAQFMAPQSVGSAVAKLMASGAHGVMVTERGTAFGHGDLVVDMRGIPQMRGLGVPVCFDATHSVQKPGSLGDSTGGDRSMVPFLANGAAGVGVDALFVEVHDNPDAALSDGPNMLELASLPGVLAKVLAIDRVVRGGK